MATRSGLRSVVAVDSDRHWVDVVRQQPEIDAAIRGGRADIRQALGPGWIGLRTVRQYADQPDRTGVVSSWRGRANWADRTVMTATSSSSVGEPLTMEKSGS